MKLKSKRNNYIFEKAENIEDNQLGSIIYNKACIEVMKKLGKSTLKIIV
jgi:hypothetical protein